jgi:chloramphenicol-sensitive protein RarD
LKGWDLVKISFTSLNFNEEKQGITYGAIAYTLWGLLPLYWKVIKTVPAYEILAHRIVWSFAFVFLILLLSGSSNKIMNILKNKKCMTYIIMCSILISINWYIYIWAVNSGHIVDSSLGYYINPLMSVLLGMLVLKEKLNTAQYIALIIAALAVVLMVVIYGSIPWISLGLAVSFGLYGLCKKMVSAEATVGLAIETMILAPVALIFLIYSGFNGTSSYGSTLTVTVLLSLSGIATATPLLFFAKSSKLVKLSTLGFLQYISPTISLIIGLFVYKEHFSQVDILGFGLIWAALIIYSSSILKKNKLIPQSLDNRG